VTENNVGSYHNQEDMYNCHINIKAYTELHLFSTAELLRKNLGSAGMESHFHNDQLEFYTFFYHMQLRGFWAVRPMLSAAAMLTEWLPTENAVRSLITIGQLPVWNHM